MRDRTEPPPEPADWPALWDALLRSRTQDGAWPPAAAEPPAWSAGSAALARLYAPLLRAPWVLAQLGQSLDGQIATHSGDSYFVTGPASLLHLHRLRALCDVVLAGAGTVAADDPQLTTRRVPGPQPVRAVLDPAARLDGRARVFHDDRAPTLWLCDARHAAAARSRLPPGATSGVEVIDIDGLLRPDGAFDPAAVLLALRARGLRCVFVEGGGATVSRFLAAGALDRLHLVIAPVLIGTGRPGLRLPPRAAMQECPRVPAQTLALGDDVLWDLDLRAAQPPIGP